MLKIPFHTSIIGMSFYFLFGLVSPTNAESVLIPPEVLIKNSPMPSILKEYPSVIICHRYNPSVPGNQGVAVTVLYLSRITYDMDKYGNTTYVSSLKYMSQITKVRVLSIEFSGPNFQGRKINMGRLFGPCADMYTLKPL